MGDLSTSAFLEFFRYNNWANQQVLQACLALSDSQLDTYVPGAYGTIRETLEHIVRSEASYVRQLTGTRPQPPFKWEDRPTVAAFSAYAAEVGEALIETASRVSPAQRVAAHWNDQAMDFQALAIFIQIINHGIEHRTNITTLLNQGIATPPAVDGWTYLTANPERFDLKLSELPSR